jgi:hypothetical protein
VCGVGTDARDAHQLFERLQIVVRIAWAAVQSQQRDSSPRIPRDSIPDSTALYRDVPYHPNSFIAFSPRIFARSDSEANSNI